MNATLHMIASAIRAAACCASREWAISLLFIREDGGGEVLKSPRVVSVPVRPTELGEIVRANLVDLNLVAAGPVVHRLLCMELEPFFVGVGNARAHETPEGLVVFRLDPWESKDSHESHGPFCASEENLTPPDGGR